MGRNSLAIVVMGLLCMAAPVVRADDAAMKAPAAAPAPEKTETFKGMINPPKGGQGTASLMVKGEEAKDKAKWCNLYGADATATASIAELLKKKGNVVVTGVLAPDGVSLKVKSIEAGEEKKKK